jgi:hypothetical protein
MLENLLEDFLNGVKLHEAPQDLLVVVRVLLVGVLLVGVLLLVVYLPYIYIFNDIIIHYFAKND